MYFSYIALILCPVSLALVETNFRRDGEVLNNVDNLDAVGLHENLTNIPKKYRPIWDDLDKRPLPAWYDKAKIGIFLHWGVFSVPSFGSEWFWLNWNSSQDKYVQFMKKNYPPGFSYQDFGPMFTAEFFDPDKWAKLFAKAGAKYIVLTSKHHEGFTLFPSSRSFSWNSVDIGPHRDLVGDLAAAVRAQGLKFGVYHSLFEWFNPIYQEDKLNLYTTQEYVFHKLIPDLGQLVMDYHPSVIWSDGDWEALDTYWNSTKILAWLYNDSPVKDEIVVNDRWGIGTNCHHGDFYNCADRYNPGKLQTHKWENAFTLDSKSWGYRRNMDLKDILTMKDILQELVSTVSCGGNVLINVGPTKEGTIPLIFEDRLLSLGSWLSINGEAIYESSPWKHQNDSATGDAWYTCTKLKYDGRRPTARPRRGEELTAIYSIFLTWPHDDVVRLKDITLEMYLKHHTVQLLGNEETNLPWKINNGTTWIHLPNKPKSKHAWTLKFTPEK